ncbi:MAG: hypothetical protein BAJATHORv1_50139 [Candidatus Thorarchaeota archaeon]|nr:MAG: hypothetical protein BAJATHORv1_50139 [Candidatus Thorarchaeota archaeon]
MRIFLITAAEPFYIPHFLKGFLEKYQGELVGVALIPPHPRKMSFFRYIKNHYNLYGLKDFIRMGFRYFKKKYVHKVMRSIGFNRPLDAEHLLKKHGCPIHRPKNVNSSKFRETLKDYDLDLIVSVASSQIFKTKLLNLPKIGCINMHGSLLPKHKGINPSFWALLEGDRETGISVHFMDESIDTGKVLKQQKVPILENETLDSLSKKIANLGVDVLIEALNLIESGIADKKAFYPTGEGSYHSFPTKSEGKEFRKKGKKFL